MTNLEILYASDDCGIDDYGLIGLHLKKLVAYGNPKITRFERSENLVERSETRI